MENQTPINSPNVSASVDLPDYANEEDNVTKRSGTKYIIHTAVMSATIASVVVQILAMVVERKVLMFVAGGLALLLAIVVASRQVLMARMDTLRDVHNKLREEVNRMTGENNELHSSVDELETEVGRVQDIEKKLLEIAKADNTNVDHLVKLVNENAITLQRQAQCLKGAVAEQVLTSVLRTDRDSDLKITDREVDILVARLKHQDGIKIDEEQLRAVLKKNDGTIGSLMGFFRSMMDDEESTERSIISVDVESLHHRE